MVDVYGEDFARNGDGKPEKKHTLIEKINWLFRDNPKMRDEVLKIYKDSINDLKEQNFKMSMFTTSEFDNGFTEALRQFKKLINENYAEVLK